MEGKKISFGFMKTKKAEKTVVEEKKDYIECVEEKSIKVVGGVTVEENTPLVIPMKPNTLVTAERLKQIAEKVESALEEPETNEKPTIIENKAAENETLDQMVVRELMQDAKREVKVDTSMLTVPIPLKSVIDGQNESTLGDYESVPVQEFGLAMLRGMGWSPSKEQSKYKPPQLRPKGLGLGADKVVKENQKKKSMKDEKDEELAIVKNSFVKITTGKYSGYYGKVVSLDEDNGRVMVDIPVKKETISLSEFMMYPVTKTEFDKESKVINADSYEDYKKNEKVAHTSSKYAEKDASSNRTTCDVSSKEKKEGSRSRGAENSSNENNKNRNRHKRDSSSSEDRSSRRRDKEKKRYSSSESLSSLSDSDRRRRKKKERRRRSSESSDSKTTSKKRSGTPEGKRDIDKKRKGKKKKRDRDRSPNYRKHRK